MDRSDVTATVGELAAAGLVERAADAGDRRRNVITITAADLARLRDLDAILTSVQDRGACAAVGPVSGPRPPACRRG